MHALTDKGATRSVRENLSVIARAAHGLNYRLQEKDDAAFRWRESTAFSDHIYGLRGEPLSWERAKQTNGQQQPVETAAQFRPGGADR